MNDLNIVNHTYFYSDRLQVLHDRFDLSANNFGWYCMDGAYPASLSAKVHTLLRDTLGFTGVIVTDDLAMDAVKAYAQDGSAAVLAIQAGNDMIVTTDYQTQIPQAIAAVQSGEIAESDIDAHVFRVLHEKQALGLID